MTTDPPVSNRMLATSERFRLGCVMRPRLSDSTSALPDDHVEHPNWRSVPIFSDSSGSKPVRPDIQIPCFVPTIQHLGPPMLYSQDEYGTPTTRLVLILRMRYTPLLISMALTVSAFCLLPIPAFSQDDGRALAKQALEECTKGRLATSRHERLAHFQQGQRLGEQAVATDDSNPDTHFALFCNLGELLRVDGETLTSIFGLRRMMSELDRALDLNPAHIDALSAKGTLLVKLPGFLGGNLGKGEQLLHHVVKQAPQSVNARLALARVWCGQGRHQDAMLLASEALALAEKYQRLDFIPEATAVLQQAKAYAIKSKDHPS